MYMISLIHFYYIVPSIFSVLSFNMFNNHLLNNLIATQVKSSKMINALYAFPISFVASIQTFSVLLLLFVLCFLFFVPAYTVHVVISMPPEILYPHL